MDQKNQREEEIKKKFEKACTLHQQGESQAALSLYNELLHLFPKAFLLHYNVGLLYYEEREFARALHHYEIAHNEHPENYDALINLALCQKKLGKLLEAKENFEKAIHLPESDIECLYNLGGCLLELEDFGAAKNCYEALLDHDGNYLPARNNLAYCCHRLHLKAEALEHYRKLLTANPEHKSAQHMIATITGEHNNHTSADYVTELFDDYAENFEQSLLEKLHYQVPSHLRDLVKSGKSRKRAWKHMLDLGCGTGLAGEALAAYCNAISGVDLSTKMIEKAAEKGIYQQLAVADIEEFVQSNNQRYDLLVAADVFSYIGELNTVFNHLQEVTEEGAELFFSVERHKNQDDKNDLTLEETGRFTHSEKYIEEILQQYGWQINYQECLTIRHEAGEEVQGWIFACTQTSLGQESSTTHKKAE